MGVLNKDRLMFSVSDNGVGFDPRDRPGMEQGHFGIEGVMERVKGLGGGIDITSAPGNGTSITIKIPIRQEA
jgi:signal transduction histidine kinase